MKALVLLIPILAGLAFAAIAWWLERATRRPGLFSLICGVCLLVGAGYGLARGYRLLPLVFGVQSFGFFYLARWQHAKTRAGRAHAAKA